MKLAVNVFLSLAMLALCLWLVWPDADEWVKIKGAFHELGWAEWPYLAGYLGLLAVTHFCRAWRWNNLLEPLGVRLSPGRLLTISSVGFMAILALPARLGEFVRPALIRKSGEISASAALGTVAVERIIDGLLVSVFLFGALFAIRGPDSPDWMMPTAWASLGVFIAATVFLGFALRWPDRTVKTAVSMSQIRRISPAAGDFVEEKLHAMISGFTVLKDKRNLFVFTAWSLVYWASNALSLWVLAQGFGLELSPLAAAAVTGLVAVGITLPNSPGLVGQYHWLVILGLGLYMPEAIANTDGKAFAIVLHGLQVVWYVGIGFLCMASRHVSFAEVAASRHLAEDLDDESPS